MNARRASTLLVLALVTLAWASCTELRAQEQLPSDSPKVAKLLRQGDALLEKGKHESALEKFESAHEIAEGTSFDALMGLARTQRLMGDLAQAAERAHEAIEIGVSSSQEAEAKTLIGRCYFQAMTRAQLDRARTSDEGEKERISQIVEKLREKTESFLRQALEDSPETTGEARYLLASVLDAQQAELRRQLLEEYLVIEPKGEFARLVHSRLEYESCVESLEIEPSPLSGDMKPPIKIVESLEIEPSSLSGDVKPPIKIYAPQPLYTEKARKAGVEGVVILEGVVDLEGNVVCLAVLKGLPMGLDRTAWEAVRHWKYEPATLDGKPVHVYFTFTITFSLSGKSRR